MIRFFKDIGMNNNMIYWRGVCIGEMINPIVDNFDVFGKWKQNGNANEQASLIKEIEDNEEAYICFGNVKSGFIATVVEVPDDYIDIRCRGHYEDMQTLTHTPEYYDVLIRKRKHDG